MDAGFFRGTNSEQDRRFGDKNQKLMKTLKFADVLKSKVDMKKVKIDILRPWIAQRILEIAGVDDDVVAGYATEMLEKERFPDPKLMQINLTGFMTAKFARKFMEELWSLLVSAQSNDLGIPQAILDNQKARLDEDHAEKRRIVEQIKQRLPHLNNVTLPAENTVAGTDDFSLDQLVEVKPEAVAVNAGKVSTSDKNSASSPTTESSTKSYQQNVANKAVSASSLALLSAASAAVVAAPVVKAEKQSLAKMVEKLHKTTVSAKQSGMPDRPKFGRNILTEREDSHYRRYRRRRTGHRRSSSYSSRSGSSRSRSSSSSRSRSSRSRSPPARRGGRIRYGRQRRRSTTRSPSPIDEKVRHGSRDRYGRPRQRPSRRDNEDDAEDARTIAQRHGRNRDRDYRLNGRSHVERRSKDDSRDYDRRSRDRRREKDRRPRTPSPASTSSESSSASSRRSSPVERRHKRREETKRSPSVAKDRQKPSRRMERDSTPVERDDKRAASIDSFGRPRRRKVSKPASPAPPDADRRNGATARSRRDDAESEPQRNGRDAVHKNKSRDSTAAEKPSSARIRPSAAQRRRSPSSSRSRSRSPEQRTINRRDRDAETRQKESRSRRDKQHRSPSKDAAEVSKKSSSIGTHRNNDNDNKDDRRRSGVANVHSKATAARDASPSPASIKSKKPLRTDDSSKVDEKRKERPLDTRGTSDRHKSSRTDDVKRNKDKEVAKENENKRRRRPSPSPSDDTAPRTPSHSPPAAKSSQHQQGKRSGKSHDRQISVDRATAARRQKDALRKLEEPNAKAASRTKRPKIDEEKLSSRVVDKKSNQDETVSSSDTAEASRNRRHDDRRDDRSRHRQHRHAASPTSPKTDRKKSGKRSRTPSHTPDATKQKTAATIDSRLAVAATVPPDESSWAVEAELFLKGELGSRTASNSASVRPSRKPSSTQIGGDDATSQRAEESRHQAIEAEPDRNAMEKTSKRERSATPGTPEDTPPPRTPTTSPPPFLLLQANHQQHVDTGDDAGKLSAKNSADHVAEAERLECIRAQQQLRSSFITPSPTKNFMAPSSAAAAASGSDRYRSRPTASTPTNSETVSQVSDSAGSSSRQDKYRRLTTSSSNRNLENLATQSPGRNISPPSSSTSASVSRLSSANKSAYYGKTRPDEDRRSSSHLSSTDAENVAADPSADDVPAEAKNSPDDSANREGVTQRDGSRSRSGSHNSLEELKKQEWYQQRLKQGEDKQRERSERRQRKLERKRERAAAKEESKQQKRKTQKRDGASEDEAAES